MHAIFASSSSASSSHSFTASPIRSQNSSTLTVYEAEASPFELEANPRTGTTYNGHVTS